MYESRIIRQHSGEHNLSGRICIESKYAPLIGPYSIDRYVPEAVEPERPDEVPVVVGLESAHLDAADGLN